MVAREGQSEDYYVNMIPLGAIQLTWLITDVFVIQTHFHSVFKKNKAKTKLKQKRVTKSR